MNSKSLYQIKKILRDNHFKKVDALHCEIAEKREEFTMVLVDFKRFPLGSKYYYMWKFILNCIHDQIGELEDDLRAYTTT